MTRLIILFTITSITKHSLEAGVFQKADRLLEDLSNALFWETENGQVAIQLGGQAEWVGFASDEKGNPPGFFFPEKSEKSGYAPRLEINADLFIGEYFTAFAKIRWDHGVHPGSAQLYGDHTEVRLDEAYAKLRLGDTGASVRIGQFTPQIGGFLARLSSWDNSLINYPLLYENVTSITDNQFPANDDSFARRADLPDLKAVWIPVIWAPLYNRGISVDGTRGSYSYSLNFLNSNISSRPEVWNDNTWSAPTVTGRLGYRPSPNWDIGLSLATGSYLREPLSAGPPLPSSTRRSDYQQQTAGIDISYISHRWQVWAEAWYSEYEIPNFLESPKVYSYFIEGRYDFSTKSWVSLRWNHELYNTLTDTSTGRDYEWDNPIYRIDLGYGIRWSRHLQTKFQYSYQHQDANFQNAEHFGAIECIIKL